MNAEEKQALIDFLKFLIAGSAGQHKQIYEIALAALTAQPVAWFTDDAETDKSATTYSEQVAERWRSKNWPVTPLFTHPAGYEVQE